MRAKWLCAVCGMAIHPGRHSGGWRHENGAHVDHRVQKIAREDFERVTRQQPSARSLARDTVGEPDDES